MAQTTRTAAELVERILPRRAVEAAICGMPLVNFDAMRQAYFRDAGAKYNDVMYWSKPSDWKNQTTTPNHSTNYVMFFMNLQDGPVVVDIPAAEQEALYGTLIDSWTIPLLNVGNTGEDKGKGAKYLLLSPGSKEKPPAGYVPVPCVTYNCYSLLRLITKTHSAEDLHKGIAYLKRLKVYPLANAAPPPDKVYIYVNDYREPMYLIRGTDAKGTLLDGKHRLHCDVPQGRPAAGRPLARRVLVADHVRQGVSHAAELTERLHQCRYGLARRQ